jgi:16S rRNA (guanine1516-N2)-methyltransferase
VSDMPVNRGPGNVALVLESTDAARREFARDIAHRTGLAMIDLSGNESHALPTSLNAVLVAVRDDTIELRDRTTRPGRGITIDFAWVAPEHARRGGNFSRKQPLARAIGAQSNTVLDATAGLGHDAALLARFGYRVIAVERSEILAAMLDDALRRALLNDKLRRILDDRLNIIHGNAYELLPKISSDIDAVYIDPMFPSKRKASALAKKSIRLVRQIVGEDEDAAELLAVARQHCRRVVVKRPTYAPPLETAPAFSVSSKLVRYDVYLR